MKKMVAAMVMYVVLTGQLMAAGFSVIKMDEPDKFMDSVVKNKKKYCKVISDNISHGFRTYVYRLDFQIIAQVAGHGYVATVIGLEDETGDMVKKIDEAKEEILGLESGVNYARHKVIKGQAVL